MISNSIPAQTTFICLTYEYSIVKYCMLDCINLNQLLDRVVSGACFLSGAVLNCDFFHRRSVAVLCMLYKIRCNPKHPLCGALPVPCVPVRIARGALIARISVYFCASTLQNQTVSQDFYSPLSISLE